LSEQRFCDKDSRGGDSMLILVEDDFIVI